MANSLLATKLYIPPARSDTIARPHLTETLLSGLDRPGSFALISGPAGFGKTTLLSNFVTSFQQPVSWVSLDDGDNDFSQFWTYLINACQSILAGVGEAALELLGASQPLPDETVPTILINDLVARTGSVVLVLDDYHAIQNPAIHRSLQFLLNHLSDNLYIIISTRTDPPWPLARYRARNRLIEIRARDLRFRTEEATEFLNRTMCLDLPAEYVAALEERTEGWIAGLQLAALSMQGHHDVPAFVKAFTGSHIYVAEYLVEEVLQHQPEHIQSFLLRTSMLKRMNADLCEALTNCPDGQAILQLLHRENIFVIPLDNEGQWFRYHHLFADLLQARLKQSLSPEELTSLQRRAADWHERNGFLPEAVNFALATKDFERVARLVKKSAHALLFTGQVNILKNWLEVLPEESLRAHPQLVFYQYWVDVLQNKADLSEGAIREQEELLKASPSSPENDRLRGELMSVISRAVALSGRTSEGIRLAKEALACLPEDDLASRARANSAFAAAHDLEGRAEEAMPAYQDSISQSIAAGDYRLAAHTLMVKGLIQVQYGHLHEAAGTFQTIVDMTPADPTRGETAKKDRSNRMFLPAGQGYTGLGCIHLEWNDLDTAESYLERGIELCHQGGLDGIFVGKLQMSRLRQARGDLEGALQELQLQDPSARRVDNFNLAIRQIQIALARGDVDGALQWSAPFTNMVEREPAHTGRPPLVFLEIIEAMIARVYLACGEISRTLNVLARLESTAKPGKRLARLIEVDLLRALTYQKKNNGRPTTQSIQIIEHALELGEPQGYATLFLEEGTALIPLLNAVADRHAARKGVRKYARQLLAAFNETAEPKEEKAGKETVDLVEQLTPREMEVLELLSIGDSNQTIADKLVITVRTVKKHTGNIYGKLGAGSRIQAVTRANELGLLPKD